MSDLSNEPPPTIFYSDDQVEQALVPMLGALDDKELEEWWDKTVSSLIDDKNTPIDNHGFSIVHSQVR